MADSQRHDGPSLSLLAVTCIALLFGGLAIGVALGGIMPLPYGAGRPNPALRANPIVGGAHHRGGGVRLVGAARGLRRDRQRPAALAR